MTKNVSVPEGYKKTELGAIPEEWEVIKIDQFSANVKYEKVRKVQSKNLKELFTDDDIHRMSSVK